MEGGIEETMWERRGGSPWERKLTMATVVAALTTIHASVLRSTEPLLRRLLADSGLDSRDENLLAQL